jgi:hypothetical protein
MATSSTVMTGLEAGHPDAEKRCVLPTEITGTRPVMTWRIGKRHGRSMDLL